MNVEMDAREAAQAGASAASANTPNPASADIAPPLVLGDAEPASFDEMGLFPEVKQALLEMGFVEPMAVQRAVYPRMMAGRDVMVQSRTGSGKTAAFGIPFAQGLVRGEEKRVQALVLAPTRELALQVGKECGRICARRDITVAAIYGGAPMGRQIEQLQAGSQIVAGTPGRVLDHLRRGTLKLDGLKVLVLDEADEMLSMGFYEELTEIIKRCPKERQTVLFSATIPEEIERIGSRYMKQPEKIHLSADFVGVREIAHVYYLVSGMGRVHDLVRILDVEQPESAIIFCNTRDDTTLVAEFLRQNGLDAEAISSDLTQKDRERVMARMKAKQLHYLVATDIAARGIDISDLSHVINYTFPESAEVYVHRTGRTGRAGKSGMAVSLISPRELGNFYMLKLTYKIRPEERLLPSEEEYQAHKEGELVTELERRIGERSVSSKWTSLARRVWSSEQGERLVGVLLEERLSSSPSSGAPEPIPVRERVAAEAEAAPSERASEPLSGPTGLARGRGADAGEGAAARSSHRHAHGPAPRSSRSQTRPSQGSGRGSARPNSEASASQEPARAGTSELGRGARRGRRSEPVSVERAKGSPQAAAGPRSLGTIEPAEHQEFWEAWVDARNQGGSSSDAASANQAGAVEPAVPAPERERAPRRTEMPPGKVRLYLNLGRRDGLDAVALAELLAQRGVTADEVSLQHSHSYLLVPEESAPATCAALQGSSFNEREIVCEPARK